MATVADHDGSTPATQHVLVIDDEDYIADMLASALRLEGYAVDVAYNGRDGLERARVLNPSLLIIDIMMPYMSGTVLMEHLRKEDHLRDVPILLISAGAHPQSFDHHVTFIPKPFDLEYVLDVVARSIGEAA